MINVLFLCPKNDGLSQIAEALLNKSGHSHFKAFSAGFQTAVIPPVVARILKDTDAELKTCRSKTVEEFAGIYFDYVIWLGQDIPLESLPILRDEKTRMGCWHMTPLELNGTLEAGLNKLRQTAQLIQTRVQFLVLSHHEEALRSGKDLIAV